MTVVLLLLVSWGGMRLNSLFGLLNQMMDDE
jgi:hypothetical protein